MTERSEFKAVASVQAEVITGEPVRDPFIRWDNSFMTVGEVGIPVSGNLKEQINPNGYSFDTDPFIRRDNPFMRVKRAR